MEKTLLDEFAMAALTGLFSDPSRMATSDNYASEAYKYAQAMMEERKKHIEAKDGGWIDWNGGIDQVKCDQLVEVIFRDGAKTSNKCEVFLWNHDGSSSDIIKFRVLK